MVTPCITKLLINPPPDILRIRIMSAAIGFIYAQPQLCKISKFISTAQTPGWVWFEAVLSLCHTANSENGSRGSLGGLGLRIAFSVARCEFEDQRVVVAKRLTCLLVV